FVSAIDADTKGLIKVFGVVKDIIGDKVIDSNQQILSINYSINQGRFIINNISIEKEKPNSQKEVKEEK
ncbi:conjugal transfer protein TraE, partial [Campylobacter upsaliensis]|nr:conjugal transfer protein TraE [Campylobacter upsaliensis]